MWCDVCFPYFGLGQFHCVDRGTAATRPPGLARGEREISFRQATALSFFWIVLALLFGMVVFALAGSERGGEYLAGYVIEKSLSVDNVFVFALIFSYFAVPNRYQYRVLFWGVVGALVLRGIFIARGSSLSRRGSSTQHLCSRSSPW